MYEIFLINSIENGISADDFNEMYQLHQNKIITFSKAAKQIWNYKNNSLLGVTNEEIYKIPSTDNYYSVFAYNSPPIK